MPKKTDEEIAAEAAATKAAAEAAAAVHAAAVKAAEDAKNAGFPANTPVAEMKPEEQAAYWRSEAKKQQKKNEGVDVEQLKKDAAELAALKAATATDADKALEEARREGENIGAGRYLTDAVKAKFQALTGKTDEEVETTFGHVDPKSFTDDKGEIVAEKLKAFADTFGVKVGAAGGDPVAEALKRQRQAAGGGATSIADKRKETRERMTPQKTNA